MNAILLKNTYYNIRSWIFAITATLAIHFILFAIFIPEKYPPTEIVSATKPQIMMLPVNSKYSNSRIQEITAWMNNENPTLIVYPNNQFGYSSIVKWDSSLPAPKNISDYKAELLTQIIFLSSMKIPEIPIRYNTLKDFFESLTAAYPFAVSNMKVTAAELNNERTHYPHVEDMYLGYVLPVKFFNLGEKNSLIKKYNPSSSTVLKMNYPKNPSLLPSGFIIESCGIHELDKIGLDTIITQDFPDYIKNKLAEKNIYLRIDWQAPYTKYSK